MNKKFFFSMLLFCCISSVSLAQSGPKFGIKAGLNLGKAQLEASGIGLNLEFETEYRTSFYAGAFAEFELDSLASNLYAQVELQYVNNGFKMEEAAFTGEFTNKVQQLNIPLLLKYKVIKQLAVTGGAYGGFILRVDEEDAEEDSYETSDDYKVFDAGLLVGAEVAITEDIFVEARYNHGLLNIIDMQPEEGEGTYKNRFLQFGIGYRF